MADLTDKEREDLVAYLDGELDEQAARELETRLTLDPQARAEAAALKKTWEMLDYLPRAEPSAGFTHRTLELTATRARKARWPAWAVGLGWAAAVLLAGGAGFAGMRYLTRPAAPAGQARPDPLAGMAPAEVDNQLARNLRVLENQHLYANVEDLQFLRELDEPDLFGEEW